ncbi:MAG: hypothetical protein IKP22_15590 [Clostridia bacterium]|nr:hypothetical protein [Clostridia bacterium]
MIKAEAPEYYYPLDREGFVPCYLVSGPRVSDFSSPERDNNQLRYEARLREQIARHIPVDASACAHAGENSRLGLPWRFYGGQGCCFVDLSDFYSLMRRVEFDAVVSVWSPHDAALDAVLWGYAAADLYVNGELKERIDAPRYKPIRRVPFEIRLRRGLNLIYIACENLGVRDTRSTVGLQILGSEDLKVTLPDADSAKALFAALRFTEESRIEGDRLVFPFPAPKDTDVVCRHSEVDFARTRDEKHRITADGLTTVQLMEGEPLVRLRVGTLFGDVLREFERTEVIRPKRSDPVPGYEENRMMILKRIASVESLSRGEKFGFPISNMLARSYLHDHSRDDARLMGEMLELIESRVDCSDFLVAGLIRYMKNIPLDSETSEHIRRVLTGYRYWMTMDGFDGMCFWSENHCLMFYTNAMLAGEMYPDDFFPLAGMTGKELHDFGREKVLEWLEDVEGYGYEEFLSTVYMCVTFAALINVVDYAPEDISRRAARLTDLLLRSLARHTFRGGIIAPMGRVYRDVLYPFWQGAMALMNLADPSQPYDFGEGWLGFFATSRYELPDGLKEIMASKCSMSYSTGNALIFLEKQEDFLLTSVASPRTDGKERWPNIIRDPGADPASHMFTKSYNECFHGTTFFRPGVYGYQQHMWYAALSGEAVLFANHPGSASEGGDMRPGYWHGNGVMPMLRQEKNMLLMIYRIPEEHPLHFIHVYAPLCRFDRVIEEENWIFLQKDRGYIAFWSSVSMEDAVGLNTGCEKRMYGDDIACVCLCGGRECASLEEFILRARALSPRYDNSASCLWAGNDRMEYVRGEDTTQYL